MSPVFAGKIDATLPPVRITLPITGQGGRRGYKGVKGSQVGGDLTGSEAKPSPHRWVPHIVSAKHRPIRAYE